MTDLRVEFDYLTLDTEEWLADIGTADDELSEELTAYAGGEYVTAEVVTEWLSERFGHVTGIYGDGGPVTVSTCNEDTFLSDDITFTYANTDDGDAYVIVHGHGAFLDSRAEVYRFTGDDDADAFSHSRGYATHATEVSCGVDWVLDNPVTLSPNGGMDAHRVENYIVDGVLRCPVCGGELHASTY